jgi:hypothetical protein
MTSARTQAIPLREVHPMAKHIAVIYPLDDIEYQRAV